MVVGARAKVGERPFLPASPGAIRSILRPLEGGRRLVQRWVLMLAKIDAFARLPQSTSCLVRSPA